MRLVTVARRLLVLLPMLALVALMIFGITYLIPGDAAGTIAGDGASSADIDRIRRELGLDDPFLVQFWNWFSDVVRGDLGTSLATGRDVSTILADRAPVSMALGFTGLAFGIVIGVPLGTLAGTRAGTWVDRASVVTASIGQAMPNFWLGLIFVTVFAVNIGWFPASGYVPFSESPLEWLRHVTLPALALGLGSAAEIARQTRASLASTLSYDYVRTARMKGLPGRSVVGKHAMKNAASPVITTIGLQATVLLGGTIIVERVFGIPGLGGVALDAVAARDIPVIQGIVLLTTLIAIVVNLLVDLVQMYLNPRVSVS